MNKVFKLKNKNFKKFWGKYKQQFWGKDDEKLAFLPKHKNAFPL